MSAVINDVMFRRLSRLGIGKPMGLGIFFPFFAGSRIQSQIRFDIEFVR